MSTEDKIVKGQVADIGNVYVTITGNGDSNDSYYTLIAGGGSSCALRYTITLTQDVTIYCSATNPQA